MKTENHVFPTLFCTALAASVLCGPVRAADCWQERIKPVLTPRMYHTAVWTGTEMIVWGGFDGTVSFNNGARFNPATNSWNPVTATGAPAARNSHTVVWTGTEMIIWGGATHIPGTLLNSGGRYNPATNSWTAVATAGAPSPRRHHTAVWTGTEMIVWGGSDGGAANTGGRYNPATNTWTPTNSLAPAGRKHHTAVWTGSEMIVWGGANAGAAQFNNGGRYNPAGNYWTALTTTGAPAAREYHTAVWTGSELIIWGGLGSDYSGLNAGGRYNPAADNWTDMATTGAPPGSAGNAAVWTGSEMIVWGGSGGNTVLNTGGRYNPMANSWTILTASGAPSARSVPTGVWTGTEMIVWGGTAAYPSTVKFNDTFSYTPDGGVFRITDMVHDNGNLILKFPSRIGRTYTLWRSDTLAGGTWTPSGLPSIPGDGTDKFFSVGAPAAGITKRFYRVQAAP